APSRCVDTVAGKPSGDIFDTAVGRLRIMILVDFRDDGFLAEAQQGQRIANRAARFSRILPSNENPLGLQFDTVWNQEQRASGPHDEISGIERGFVSALANNHE